MATVPRPGIGDGSAAGHVGHHDHLGPHHGRDPHVLGQVVVVADQEADLDAEQVDDVVSVARRDVGADERVQLVILGDEAVGPDRDIALVELARPAPPRSAPP